MLPIFRLEIEQSIADVSARRLIVLKGCGKRGVAGSKGRIFSVPDAAAGIAGRPVDQNRASQSPC